MKRGRMYEPCAWYMSRMGLPKRKEGGRGASRSDGQGVVTLCGVRGYVSGAV